MGSKEENFDIPNPVNDPNIGQYQVNLTIKVTGADNTPYQNDFLELGFTFDKVINQNRVSFNTSRPGEFPENFVQDIQSKMPEILLGVIFGAMSDGRLPEDLRNYDHMVQT